jgi:hypothetical protein
MGGGGDMPFPIGQHPAHGFDQPLSLLSDALRLHLGRLPDLYERHISTEDHELLPAAAQVLSVEDLRAVGREMAGRRTVSLPAGA